MGSQKPFHHFLHLSLPLFISLLPPPTLCISHFSTYLHLFPPLNPANTPKSPWANHKNICQRAAQPPRFTNIQMESWFELSWDALPHWQKVEGNLKLKNHSFESEMLLRGCLNLSNDKLGTCDDKWSLKYQRTVRRLKSKMNELPLWADCGVNSSEALLWSKEDTLHLSFTQPKCVCSSKCAIPFWFAS